MSTRIYLSSTISAPISPLISSEWEVNEASYKWCNHVKQNTSATSFYILNPPIYTPTPFNVCALVFITDSLEAQTINGTVKGQIRVRQPKEGDEWCRAILIKVVSEDGSVERGTLLSHFPETLVSEWDYYWSVNRKFPPSETALNQVSVQNGDRIIIELGCRSWSNGFTQGFVCGNIEIGDDNETDLPEDEVSFAYDYNPWIEFSADIQFKERIIVSQNLAMVLTSQTPILKVYQNTSFVLTSEEPKIKIFQVVGQVLYQLPQSNNDLWFCHG